MKLTAFLSILILTISFHAYAKPLRIVVLNSDGLEVMRALKAADMVVGISDVIAKEPSFWGKYSKFPMAGGWRDPDYEAIAKLKPDYVLSYVKSPGAEADDKLGRLGIKMLRYDFYKISVFEEEVKSFASVIGRQKEAAELLGWWEPLFNRIKDDTAKVKELPKVYIEGYGIFRSSGPGSGFHEMITLAGGKNIAGGASIPYLEVEPEWVYTQKPAYVVKMIPDRDCYGGGCGGRLKETYDEIKSRQGLRLLDSVRNGKILVLTSDLGPGPRALLGVVEMAKRLHPELFKNMNPAALNAEYLKRFQGLKYSGIYVYPAVAK